MATTALRQQARHCHRLFAHGKFSICDSANSPGCIVYLAWPGKAAVDAGDIPTSATADWSSVNLYRKGGSDTWPIESRRLQDAVGRFEHNVAMRFPKVLVSYIYLHKDV